MSAKSERKCTKCNSADSPVWRTKGGLRLCNGCFTNNDNNMPKIEEKDDGNLEDGDTSTVVSADESMAQDTTMETSQSEAVTKEDNDDAEADKGKNVDRREQRSRKSKRSKPSSKGNVPKGKGRRYIFKKSTTKAHASVSTPITSDHLFHKGWYYQVGDIVSVVDIEGGTYYAQIRGLLQDQYCEKSAVLTWLLPTKNSPPPEEVFEPATYIIGPEEDMPRKLDYIRFVLRAPSDYFHDKTSPYATFSRKPQSCFVWSRMGPVIKPIASASEGIR